MNTISNEMLSLESSYSVFQRVHDVPELRHLILANADAPIFQALSHATPYFFASAHTPLAWAKQYAPVEIDIHSRSI